MFLANYKVCKFGVGFHTVIFIIFVVNLVIAKTRFLCVSVNAFVVY